MNPKEACLYSNTRGIQHASTQHYLRPYLCIKKDDRILDIGCGTGELVYEMSRIAQSVIGIDISENMIEVARQKCERANVTYTVAGGEDIIKQFPTWNSCFDKVVSVHVLHWIEDKRKVIQNIYECLKIGGECFLLFCGPSHQMLGHGANDLPFYLKNHSRWKDHLEGYNHRMYNQYNLADSLSLLESVGFRILNTDVFSPCEKLEIKSVRELKEYLRTLLGHLLYLPGKYHSEFLQDATDWCNQHFPVNQRGMKYCRAEIIVINAKRVVFSN